MKVLRSDLDKHECDREHHVELAVNAVPDLRQIVDKKETIDQLVAKIEMSKLTSDVKQQEIIEQQKNKLAQLQSIIFAQNKEISELKVKIERQTFYIPSHCGHQLQCHVDAVSPKTRSHLQLSEHLHI